MNCRETRPLLPLFFDGELEARKMRAVALHSTRCGECEDDLRRFERLQEAVAVHVSTQLDEIDLSQVWAGVAPRLEVEPRTRRRSWRDLWEGLEVGWVRRVPVYAALAAACLLAVLLWRQDAADTPREIALRDNSAILDSVHSNVGSLAVLREPETNTMVLWITDDASSSGDFGELP